MVRRVTPDAFLALTLGVLLVSTAGPFLQAAALDPFAVVFWRMAGAAAVLWAWSARRGTWRLAGPHARSLASGGALLAAHLLLWSTAFQHTDFASNMLLLVAQPVIAALWSASVGEPTSRATWWSVSLALAGLAIIAAGDVSLGSLGWQAVWGDLLSILGSVAITGSYVVTREARRALPLEVSLGGVMLGGAVVAAIAAVTTAAPLWGYPPASVGWLAALIGLTTVLGHGAMNAAARRVRLFTLNLAVVLEPPLGIALGSALLGTRLHVGHWVGGLVLMAAVLVGFAPDWASRPRGAATDGHRETDAPPGPGRQTHDPP